MGAGEGPEGHDGGLAFGEEKEGGRGGQEEPQTAVWVHDQVG